MRLMAVLLVLILATGCDLFKAQPVAQPAPPVFEQSTTGQTQTDYKAGNPDTVIEPAPAPATEANPALILETASDSTVKLFTISGGQSSTYWAAGPYTAPPELKIIYSGSCNITIKAP